MATLAQRAKLAWRILRGRPQRKALPYVWPAWRMNRSTTLWHLIDYTAYAEEGFSQNSLVYSAIMYKVRAYMSIRLGAWTGTMTDREALDDKAPLSQLLARPNEHQSMEEMQSLSLVYFNLAGNSFTLMVRPPRGGAVEEMHLLRPDRVVIIPTKNEDGEAGVAYVYVPEGRSAFLALSPAQRLERLHADDVMPIIADDMMHVKLPNPIDPLDGLGYGLSPLAPAARSVDVDNEVTRFLKEFFDRGLMPNIAFSTEDVLDDRTLGRMRERISEVFGGVDGWIEPLILEAGTSVQRLSMTFDELGFEEVDERNESRILGPWGVPAILISTRLGLKHATFSNYELARQAFWEDTLIPESRLFEVDYQHFLNANGSFVAYDYDNVPALAPQRKQRRDEIAAGFQAGAVTRNEYRAALDLEVDPRGDVYLIPMALIEIPASREAEVIEGEVEEEEPKALPAPKKALPRPGRRGLSDDARKLLWKRTDAIATRWEGKFGEQVSRSFGQQHKDLLRIARATPRLGGVALASSGGAGGVKQAAMDWDQVGVEWQKYLATLGVENLRRDFTPLIEGVIRAQGDVIESMFGFQFDVENVFATESFEDYVIQFAQPIMRTTNDDIAAMLKVATRDGWKISTMEDALAAMFERYLHQGVEFTDEERAWFEERMPLYRREAIARTETLRAANYGSTEIYRDAGITHKEWLATFDDRVRPAHAAAGAQYVEGGSPGPIPMDEPFIVGGEALMYPLDQRGSAGNVIQCRCSVAPYSPRWAEL